MARTKAKQVAGQTTIETSDALEMPGSIAKSISAYLGTAVVQKPDALPENNIVLVKPAENSELDLYVEDVKVGYLSSSKRIRPGTKSSAKLYNAVSNERVKSVYAYLSDERETAPEVTYKAELFFVPNGADSKKSESKSFVYSVIGGQSMCPGRKAFQSALIDALEAKDEDKMYQEVSVFAEQVGEMTNVYLTAPSSNVRVGLVVDDSKNTNSKLSDAEKETIHKDFMKLLSMVKTGPISGKVCAVDTVRSPQPNPYRLEITEEKSIDGIAAAIESAVKRCVEQPKMLEAKVKYLQKMDMPTNVIISILDQLRRWPDDLEAMVPVPDNLYLDNGDQSLLRSIVYRLLGKHIRLVGEKGCGKNTLINSVCWVMHRPLFMVQGNSDLDKTDLLGTRTIKNGTMGYELSTFLHVLEAGGDVDLDEANAIKPDVEILIHSLADNTKAINVPGYGKVRMGDGACMWATMNEDYVGTSDMNDATIDRFVTMRLKAPASMEKVLKQLVPTASAQNIKVCQRVHADILKAVRDQTISGTCISIRGLIDALEAAPLLGLRQALIDTVAAKPQDADERKTLESIIQNNAN